MAGTQGYHICHAGHTDGGSRFGTAQVRYKRHEVHVRILSQAGCHDFPGILQLRDRLRRYEGGDFYMPDSGLDQAVDNRHFCFGRNIFLDVLEAVPRTDFIHIYCFHCCASLYMIFFSFSASMPAASNPRSRPYISSLSWPRVGAGVDRSTGVPDILSGEPVIFISPALG